jgi:coenzyme F420 hydrogenase subunit beta
VKDRVTIESVVKRRLCTGCGTCAGICPHGAIEMVVDRKKGCYLPHPDRGLCRQCGLCYEACPGHAVDFESLDHALFGDEVPEEIALGRYLGCYIGHASDETVRYDCSSGGLVSALLIFALEEGLIDGALVTRMRKDNPLRPEPFLAGTKDEILSAAGSKYCPVAAGTALREIFQTRGRFAVVGLPCHIQGIRKAEQHIPKLKERIRFRIAIPCSLDYGFRGTEHILKKLGVWPDEVESLQYRGRGWPGSMRIGLKDGTERTIALAEYFRQLGPYSLRRCTLCSDMLGELSDLTCGDAWIPEVMETDKVGSSFVVSRTPGAEELLEAAASKEAVALSELGLRELLASQGNALFKKRKLKARMRVFRWTGRSVPTYRQKLLEPTRADYVNTLKFYVARYVLSRNRPVLGRLLRTAQSVKPRKPNDPPMQPETLARRR